MLLKISSQNRFVARPVHSGKQFPSVLPAVVLTILMVPGIILQAQDVADATSLNNKVMAGYQGWFRTPGDRPGSTSWAHVFNRSTISPENLALDTWPDMSEYGADEKYPVPGFTYPDGSQAYMYSAQNYKSVLRHFQWMKQYGIDGVWLSEFCGSFRNGRVDSAMLTIMNNVRAAATATGRTWAYMWDMSSFGRQSSKEEVYNTIVTQWKNMVDEGVTSDPRYLHHNGKPVLLIWGFFPSRPASQPDYMTPVVDFLLAPGKYQATLVAGADNKWRQGTPEFQAMLMRMSALQPWSVGRVVKDSVTGYKMPFTGEWAEDMATCKANNVIFIPVINPGTHIAGPPPVPPALPTIPRRMGNYLWQQFVTASKTGVINSAFIAMFDEVNEGTQIGKIDRRPPVQAHFLTYNGATNDYYLRLVGTASRMLKSSTPIDFPIPISPFDQKKAYIIKNQATGLVLHSAGKAAKSPVVQAKDEVAEWQLIYDGKGYFTIKNRLTGKVLAAGPAGIPVAQVAGSNKNAVKWQLEWDNTGNCRIIGKTGRQALSGGNTASADAPVIQVAATADPEELKTRDDLHWQITEQ